MINKKDLKIISGEDMKNKILFLTILILTISFSCVYAYTSDEVLAQLTILKNKGIISGLPTDYLPNNLAWNNFVNYLSNSNTTGYSIIVTGNNNNYYNNVVTLLAPQSSTVVNNRYYTNEWASYTNNSNKLNQENFHNNMSHWTSGILDNNRFNIIYAYTTVDINTTILQLQAFNEYGGNYLADALEFYPYNDEIISTNVNAIKNIYRFSVVSLGEITNYLDDDRYNYVELLQGNNIVASMTYNNISKRITNSNNMDIESNDNGDIIRVNNWILYLDELYTLNIYSGGENISKQNYNEMQTYYYIFLRENAVINNGSIINYGSGEGYTTQNSTNDIINNQNNNNTFWENAYNNLFVVSGDYIEQKLTQIKEENNFSGDLQQELAFLNLISGDKGDFVISWNSFTPHFSLKGQQINNVQMISGDSINFSKLERENPALHEAMEWARTLLCFSIGVLLIRNYWTALLHTFGVGTQIYDNISEEAKIAKQKGDKK